MSMLQYATQICINDAAEYGCHQVCGDDIQKQVQVFSPRVMVSICFYDLCLLTSVFILFKCYLERNCVSR